MKKGIFFVIALATSLQIYAQKKDSIANKYTIMD